MELCDHDLFSLVENSGPLPESLARRVFRQVVAALLHLQSLGVSHMDVKPENIMLVGDKVKLADFGSATAAVETLRPCSTVLYASPEGLEAMDARNSYRDVTAYSPARSDVWSLGISMVASLTGFMPWAEASPSDVRYHHWVRACARSGAEVMAACQQLMFDGVIVSPAAVELLARMLQPDASRRPTLSEIATHPWMQGAC